MATKLFGYYKLNPEGLRKADCVTRVFEHLLDDLNIHVGDGVDSREFALVRTKLEEACFYARKAVAMQKENHEGAS